jgi:hypothetical protein
MNVSIPPLSSLKVVFQIGIGLGYLDQMLDCRRMERSPSQVCVDHHSGGINDSTESGLGLSFNLSLEKRMEVFKREKGISCLRKFFFLEDLFAETSQSLSNGLDHEMAGINL